MNIRPLSKISDCLDIRIKICRFLPSAFRLSVIDANAAKFAQEGVWLGADADSSIDWQPVALV